ncbi:MAG TPA: gliding motility-associated C-terminal domain-containing protein [Sphingobacteriaceae bacterium]|nr:gliding motility-associated C-terminal domain-containing protein [Sphingobacteriaceae bacterium]
MLRKTLIYLAVCLSTYSSGNAQIVNTGQKIFIGTGGTVHVPESFKNISGSVLNNGRFIVKGDWHNNDAAGKVFDNRSTGKVILSGVNQTITGSSITSFPDLELAGSGIIALDRSAEVFGTLTLNDKEFLTKSNNLIITNTKPDAITRTTGYINTALGGRLIRNTNSTAAYSFPLGSSSASKYRPIFIEPKSNQPMSFSASFHNDNPTASGYNVLNKTSDIKSVFDKYFFLIDQVSGPDNANIKFYINTMDGDLKQMVSWGASKMWEKAPSTYLDGSFGDNLNRELHVTTNQSIKNVAFTLAELQIVTTDTPIAFFNAFSPNGDGSNDSWEIKNIDLFPDNEVSIFNRAGNEVYNTKGYSSTKVWDGGDFNSGTYYYVVKVNVNGTAKNFKGFITMLK